MLKSAMTADQLAEHYNEVARKLVKAHLEVKEEPLLLAAQLRAKDAKDLVLLEVIENFPGSPDEALFETEMPPSRDVPILGSFRLILCNLSQLEAAIKRHDKLLSPGLILYPPKNRRNSKLKKLIGSLEHKK